MEEGFKRRHLTCSKKNKEKQILIDVVLLAKEKLDID
jgi:hypothetical protein